jgi:hypothetical protein
MHLPVKPEAVEIIPQIIMIGDVPARSLAIISPRPVQKSANPSSRPIPTRHIAEGHGIRHEQCKQWNWIRTRPLAGCPCPVPASRTTSYQAQQSAPTNKADLADRAVRTSTQYPDAPVGQHRFQTALLKSRVYPVQQAMKMWSDQT